jgi:hypothetical protein
VVSIRKTSFTTSTLCSLILIFHVRLRDDDDGEELGAPSGVGASARWGRAGRAGEGIGPRTGVGPALGAALPSTATSPPSGSATARLMSIVIQSFRLWGSRIAMAGCMREGELKGGVGGHRVDRGGHMRGAGLGGCHPWMHRTTGWGWSAVTGERVRERVRV